MAITDQPRVNNPELLALQFPDTPPPFVVPKQAYEVDEGLLDALEASLVTELSDHIEHDGPSIVTVVVPWDSPYANFGRMTETQNYTGYDNHAAMEQYEARSIWLFTVDVAEGGIDHVKRLVPAIDAETRAETARTGIEVIDDRLIAAERLIGEDLAEAADLGQIQTFHGIDDIERIWNVTSNHTTNRVNDANTPDSALASAMNTLRSYKATYQLGKEGNVDALLAYLNAAAIKSLGKMGVEHELLLGREFHLPEPDKPGEYDKHYVAVTIPYTPENQACFTDVFPYEPTGDPRQDHRLGTRAFISAFIANEEVRVYDLGPSTSQDIPTVTRRM